MKIYEAKNHILINTDDISPSQHRHMAAHIIVSLDNKIEIKLENERYYDYGVLIPAGKLHKVYTDDNKVLVFLYDCSTNVAKQIKNVQTIPEEICKSIARLYSDLEKDINSNNYYRFEMECLSLLGINYSGKNENDDRINSAITYIRQSMYEKISCGEIAKKVFLSQSRFSHLFKE